MFSSRFPSRWPRGSSARPRGSQTKAIAFDISAMSGVIAAVTIGTARSKLLNTVLSGSDDTALVARDLFFSPGAPTVLDLRACTLKGQGYEVGVSVITEKQRRGR